MNGLGEEMGDKLLAQELDEWLIIHRRDVVHPAEGLLVAVRARAALQLLRQLDEVSDALNAGAEPHRPPTQHPGKQRVASSAPDRRDEIAGPIDAEALHRDVAGRAMSGLLKVRGG